MSKQESIDINRNMLIWDIRDMLWNFKLLKQGTFGRDVMKFVQKWGRDE